MKYRNCKLGHTSSQKRASCCICSKDVDLHEPHYIEATSGEGEFGPAVHITCAIAEGIAESE